MKKTKIDYKEKFETLAGYVKDYVAALRAVKAQVAGVYLEYGKPGEDNNPTKAQPNVVFVIDLINQVQTAATLGYNTHLTANAGGLFIYFVEKTPPVPVSLSYL